MKEDNNRQAPVDLAKIVKTLWGARIQFVIVLPIALVVTYLLTLCVPRYYTCTAELAPESGDNSAAGSISSLASSFGIDGLGKLAGDDAISPLLYPDLLKSPDFVLTLLPIKVTTKDGQSFIYYDYMDKQQESALWDKYIIDPIRNAFKPKEETPKYAPGDTLDFHKLTKKQDDIISGIAGKLKCTVDKKTNAITIVVEDQDPKVCTTMADSVLARIQTFIIDYRTKKARNDYQYYDKLVVDAEKKYKAKKDVYANYADTHQDAVLESVNAEEESMRDNMSRAYDVLSAMSKMRDQAKAKIQENTPAFTIIKSPILPQKPSGPKRMIISIVVMMLAGVVVAARALVKS